MKSKIVLWLRLVNVCCVMSIVQSVECGEDLVDEPRNLDRSQTRIS